MMKHFTIIDANRETTLPIMVADNHLFINQEQLRNEFGWELKPEGLCKGDVCLLISSDSQLKSDYGLDLQVLAGLWDRPLAIDQEHHVAYLGESVVLRQGSLQAGVAPDFTLPDLDGKLHSLSDHRGKKVFLIAYASW